MKRGAHTHMRTCGRRVQRGTQQSTLQMRAFLVVPGAFLQHDVDMPSPAGPAGIYATCNMHIGERGACGAIGCLAFEMYIDAVHLSLLSPSRLFQDLSGML